MFQHRDVVPVSVGCGYLFHTDSVVVCLAVVFAVFMYTNAQVLHPVRLWVDTGSVLWVYAEEEERQHMLDFSTCGEDTIHDPKGHRFPNQTVQLIVCRRRLWPRPRHLTATAVTAHRPFRTPGNTSAANGSSPPLRS